MRTPEHVQAAIDECIRLGAYFSWFVNGGNHITGVIRYKGKEKLIGMSKTPSDFRVPMKVRCQIKRCIREMNGGML